MKEIEFNGKTVDDAIETALKELNTTKDKVIIDILDNGKKGLFNFIGSKPAIIKVSVKKDYSSEAKEFLTSVLNAMGVVADIVIKDEGQAIKINLVGENMGLLIGYRGETLDAIQYLVSLAINKNQSNEYKRVIVDTENYRKKREETLRRLANRIAYKVKKTERVVKLEPMNPYERRIIHSTLQSNAYVTTFSEGEEPFRRVVVDIKKA
ncbi:MAG: RNA-binding cell elongation regulator Jag/EloR [Clostridiaceae bacterium]